MGEIQEAFEVYFSKLRDYCQKEYGSLPKVSFGDDVNRELTVGEPDEEGYIAWLPKRIQKHLDWALIEKKVNCHLHEEIKEYYTSYLFLSLSGSYKEMELDFEPISNYSAIAEMVERHLENGRYHFPGKECLLIGSGGDGVDDSYNVFYDNKDPKLVCVSTETDNIKIFNKPLSYILRTMEAIE
jgi:hypothetical protein